VQIAILAEHLPEMVAFYSQVLDAEFNELISSFQFGAWKPCSSVVDDPGGNRVQLSQR
jgi:hypothetical protein